MGKTSSALTLHELLLFCHFTLSHMLQPKFHRTPWTLLTPSLPNRYTAQTCKFSDITITCLRACCEYPRAAQALSRVSHLEGFCLEGTEFVSPIVICHVGAQTIGAETISPRVSIQVKDDSWAPCSFWGYNLKGCGGKEKTPNSESTILGAVTQLTFSLHPTKEVLLMMTKKYKCKFLYFHQTWEYMSGTDWRSFTKFSSKYNRISSFWTHTLISIWSEAYLRNCVHAVGIIFTTSSLLDKMRWINSQQLRNKLLHCLCLKTTNSSLSPQLGSESRLINPRSRIRKNRAQRVPRIGGGGSRSRG